MLAFTSPSYAHGALFGIGASTLLLLFIGIHNSWDTVTYNVFVDRGKTDVPTAKEESFSNVDDGEGAQNGFEEIGKAEGKIMRISVPFVKNFRVVASYLSVGCEATSIMLKRRRKCRAYPHTERQSRETPAVPFKKRKM